METSASDQSTRADIGLVCALPLELSTFLGRCSKVKTYTGGRFTFRGGFYQNIRVAIVESGMGRARATLDRFDRILRGARSPTEDRSDDRGRRNCEFRRRLPQD